MPSNKVHTMAGVAVGVATFFALDDEPSQNNPLMDIGLTTFAGAIGGKLPDIIEPATSPNHRAFFHSWPILAGTVLLMRELYKWQPVKAPEKQCRKFLIAACAGYSSHLFLDSLTPKSLPII